jgi:GTP cyclohydrolase IB
MKDIHSTTGNFEFDIDEAGFINIKYPMKIKTKAGNVLSTIGMFDMRVGVDKNTKGVHMSRFISILANSNIDDWYSSRFKLFLEQIEKETEGHGAFVSIKFDYFLEKEAPISKQKAIMPYKCIIESSLIDNKFDYTLTIEGVVKSLCPASKAISDYSAHNQRNYVGISIRTNTKVWIEDMIDVIELNSSSPIYPIVKRLDEKHMTETAYDNPKFTEDVTRGIASILAKDSRIDWFQIKSRAEDSILPYDAYATITISK